MTAQAETERDDQFMQSVYELMNRDFPEMKDRFGLWKIHQHFDIADDEVFHETSDLSKRESTLRIIKKTDLPLHSFATTWKLTSNGPVVATWCCDDSPFNRPKP